ncbi:MAG: hypothetical protein K9N07_00220 [Candidatus Cloacimonetes bacterium]|nr:hypothetical protein [Candidatus Cloacimonadota bacterium]
MEKVKKVMLLVGLLIFTCILSAQDDEDKSEMKFNQLPQEVQQAFNNIADTALISEIDSERETENITAYEIEISNNGEYEIDKATEEDDVEVEEENEEHD